MSDLDCDCDFGDCDCDCDCCCCCCCCDDCDCDCDKSCSWWFLNRIKFAVLYALTLIMIMVEGIILMMTPATICAVVAVAMIIIKEEEYQPNRSKKNLIPKTKKRKGGKNLILSMHQIAHVVDPLYQRIDVLINAG
ncbi:uncharacterized protein LOC110669018 isoform X2 [Hevea brasiliensis]|uniref:uncharacterized protein LOC110669018 isoform X2 n=1 Tax=Hevea brasiliensis TaxID=3981 RepID=UPI0025E93256|nr:uncharacterized protein LOC110669018 isoform X2 [Hevea brasiliensis]